MARSTASVDAPAQATLPAIELYGVRLHALTEAQCVEHVVRELDAGRGGWVVTPNLDHLRRLVREREFAELCAGADLVVPDGMPLVWAARVQGTPLSERVAGSNLIWSLSAACARTGRSAYFLGGDEGTAERAAAVLAERYPGFRCAGTRRPPFGFEDDPAEMAAIVDALVRAEPAVVFVALGSPKQERLIRALRSHLPHAWWLGIGISFSFVAGTVRRAPPWVQKLGLEWLHRLVQEPRRLARRYLVQGLPFAAVLFARAAWRRVRGRGA
ncbi:MAG: WecB/TagA/CpsF family glycosyltransferase [Planctomycetes bacterium]|nr:WecB/TagA/CpsF family glycosyltransferase [Planctomycetota bacterium]